MVSALNDEVDLGFRCGVVAPRIKLNGDAVKPQGMTYLVLVRNADSLKGQAQPGVGYRCVEVLLPIVLGGDFLGESEVKQREEVHQLVIGILHFRFAVHFGDIPSDEVAVDKVV